MLGPDPTEEAARERFKRFGLARLRSALDYCVTKRTPPPRQRRSSEMHNWRVLQSVRKHYVGLQSFRSTRRKDRESRA
jgi:hypothetical protein